MIKVYDSKKMTGLPEITNTQGDLLRMLRGLLVNGVNSKSVASLSYSNGVCVVDFGVTHNFVNYSVIDIQGTTQEALLGKDFRVSDITATTISFNCPAAVTNEAGLSVRYPPLGWEEYFSSTDKACFKSPNPLYQAYLRVDDSAGLKPANFSTAAKFAGVELCTDMTDFNTASAQAPYDPLNPNKNREYGTFNGVSMMGWFKWYYAADYRTENPDGWNPEVGVRDYILIGDDSYFWLITYPYVGATNSGRAAVFGVPIVNLGGVRQQALVAVNSSGAKKPPAHNGAFSGSSNVAVLNQPLLSSITTSFFNSKGYGQRNMLFTNTALLLDTSVSTKYYLVGEMEKIQTTITVFSDRSIINAGGVLKKAVNLDLLHYDAVFDAGSF